MRCYYIDVFSNSKRIRIYLTSPTHTRGQPAVIIPRSEHNVSRKNISRNALKVLYRLNSNGHQAFLVGGGVRDLLLEIQPKDFDIATDAPPEKVQELFRNCRLIGRRFRLAHVHFGREVIEVATFRAQDVAPASGVEPSAEAGESEPEEGRQVSEQEQLEVEAAARKSRRGRRGRRDDRAPEAGGVRVVDDSGRILRDNVYGSVDEDVWRRDFTANALYYNIDDHSIWDYAGGVEDIRNRTLRMLGDPVQRYQEDPVRMLRAVRFAAKLNFDFHPQTEAPIQELGGLLADMPPARLMDEALKMFLAGSAVDALALLTRFDLFRHLFPAADHMLKDDSQDAEYFRHLVHTGLSNSDERVAAGKTVTPVFLFCVLLWGPIRAKALQLYEAGESEIQALRTATVEVALAQQKTLSIPRRFVQGISDIACMQPRFESRRGRRPIRLLEHPRFRAGYDFLLLRVKAGEASEELSAWWTRMQEEDPEVVLSESDFGEEPSKPRKRRRRRRRPRKRATADGGAPPQ